MNLKARASEPVKAEPVEIAPEIGTARLNTKPLFKLMVDKKASDLFFTSYAPVKIKIEGQISPVNKQILSPDMVKQAAYGLMNVEQTEYFEKELEIDFAISEPGLGRFRVNVFHQRGYPAIVLRHITADMPRLEQLGMPDILRELVMLKRGLILMVGAAGAGKSTTLAAMINYRNENSSDHILTIEDPIEFLHANKKSIVNQREVGLDTKSYHRALRGAMRAAPDVILIGEIRDRESMEAAIALAGTGHLCIATLHANNSSETLDRIINMFPRDQHEQIYLDLSQYLRAILSQRLVQGKDNRRVAAVEVLLNTPHIHELIKKGDVVAVKEALRTSTERGMQDFDTALYALVKQGRIALEDALVNADSRANLETRINFG
jgi:twitching motility protein PilU